MFGGDWSSAFETLLRGGAGSHVPPPASALLNIRQSVKSLYGICVGENV